MEPAGLTTVYLPAMPSLSLLLLFATLATGATAAAASGPAPAAATPVAEAKVESGRWRQHDVSFTYSGFTSKYSCDGLAERVKWLLRELGARKDFQVSTYSCADPHGGPTEFPRVRLRFATLEPGAGTPESAAAPAAASYGHVIGREAPRLPPPAAGGIGGTARELSGDPVPGVWQTVRFDRRRPRSLEPGDCELLEQFRDRVLPLFTTRAVVDGVRCIPYQLLGTSLKLEVEVFAPVPAADAMAGRAQNR